MTALTVEQMGQKILELEDKENQRLKKHNGACRKRAVENRPKIRQLCREYYKRNREGILGKRGERYAAKGLQSTQQ